LCLGLEQNLDRAPLVHRFVRHTDETARCPHSTKRRGKQRTPKPRPRTRPERLESSGYAVRTKDEEDRRRVLVTATPQAEQRVEQVYGPVRPAGAAVLSRYTRAELETIHRFLVQGEELQDQQAERIRCQRVK
jgi:hypothetical protein